MTHEASRAAAHLKAQYPSLAPRVGLVLGSGLGSVATRIEQASRIHYRDIPGFPELTVEGHAGTLALGSLGGIPVACLQGRIHVYEGQGAQPIKTLIRTLKLLGCESLLLTCAAGSLRRDVPPGSLMAISDHINLMGSNPLVGPNDDRFGPRFPSLEDAWDPDLRGLLFRAGARHGVNVVDGIYAAYPGPSFETAAEIRMIRALGADAVGMSTVPECIVARHCGLRVAGCAVITNFGVGMDDRPVSHMQTLQAAAAGSAGLERLIVGFLENYPR